MGRWQIVALGLIALASPVVSQARTLKVLTLNFNSEIVPLDDRQNFVRDLRFKAITDFIAEQQPDVVLMQEVWNYRHYASVAQAIAEATGYDYYSRIDLGFPLVLWDSNAILAKKEFHLEQARVIKLPHSARHIGDRVHWIIPFGVITQAVGAKLTLPDGTPFFVYSIHLQGATSSARLDQLTALDQDVERLAQKNGVDPAQMNAIVAGDFNTSPDTAEIRYLLGRGYRDTWVDGQPGLASEGFTSCGDPYSPIYNPFVNAAWQMQDDAGANHRIDYIFARGPGVRTLASTVMFTHPYNGIWMSDHYGVMSTISVGPDGDSAPLPDPASDSVSLPPSAPTRVLEITDADFATCRRGIACDVKLEDQSVAGYRGFAIVNKSHRGLSVLISGKGGNALPSRTAQIGPGSVTSFYFSEPTDYRLGIFSAYAVLHARISVRETGLPN